MDKDIKRIIKALTKQGFEVAITKRGHVIVSRNGRRVATLAGTASDHRSMKNALSYLKRAGFRWPPK